MPRTFLVHIILYPVKTFCFSKKKGKPVFSKDQHFTIYLYLFLFMCMCMCHLWAGALGGQKRALGSLELELQGVGSHPIAAWGRSILL